MFSRGPKIESKGKESVKLSEAVIKRLNKNDPSFTEYVLTHKFKNKEGYSAFDKQHLFLEFCKALQHNKTLKKLQLYSMQGGSLTKDCIDDLGQALSVNTSLELLVLDGNSLTNVAKKVLSGNSTLMTIGLFGKWVSTPILKKLERRSNITSIHLGGTGRSSPSFKGMLEINEKIIDTLQQCLQLEQIQFKNCVFEKGSIKNITAAFAKKITIDNDCKLDEKDMIHLKKLQSNAGNVELSKENFNDEVDFEDPLVSEEIYHNSESAKQETVNTEKEIAEEYDDDARPNTAKKLKREYTASKEQDENSIKKQKNDTKSTPIQKFDGELFEDMSDIDDESLNREKDKEIDLNIKTLSNKEKKEIGRWGETFTYKELLEFYEKKYKSKAKNNTNGFTISGKNSNGDEKEIKVIWNNKQKDTDAAIDIELETKCNGKKKEKRYVEVKSTTETEHKKGIAELTRRQIKYMRKYGDRFRIFRVYNAESDNACIKTFKDPYKTILGNPESVSSVVHSIKIKI